MENFKIMMNIATPFQKSQGDIQRMYIRGLASGGDIDLQDDRMAKSAVEALTKAIDEGTVLPNGTWSLIPLRSGHRMEWDDILGWITKAEIDDDYNLWIEAELDDTNSVARDLFVKLQTGDRPGRPLQLGLSIGGKIKKASFEWNHDVQKRVRVIEDVLLQEISVVGKPANPATYVEALAKSVDWDAIPPPKEEILLQHAREQRDSVQKEHSMSENVNNATEVNDVEAAAIAANAEINNQNDRLNNASNSTTTEGESQVAEVTEATEPAAEVQTPEGSTPETDPNATDTGNEDLAGQVAKLQEAVTQLQTAISTLTANSAQENVAKSEESSPAAVVGTTETETEETSEDLSKSIVSDNDKIIKAVEAAFAKFKVDVIDPLTNDIKVVKSVVEEMGESPMDKSSAVRKAKEETDRIQTFQDRLEKAKGGGGHFNPLREAIVASLEG